MKPILFNTEMVRAILEGRKTVTRRVINRDIVNGCDMEKDGTLLSYENSYGDFINPIDLCGYRTGDVLYVRETWYKGLNRVLYKANYSDNEKFYENGKQIQLKWKPSIHMPKEAARIFLRVTDVRVERLQDITEAQAVKEGFVDDVEYCVGNTARGHFKDLWNSTINKKQLKYYGWEANPYVWVIEFERVERGDSL